MLKKITLFLYIFALLATAHSQNRVNPPFLNEETKWVDSILSKLTIDEKIAQLIMVPAYPELGEKNKLMVLKLIEKHKVGGILLHRSSPNQFATITNEFQNASSIPLFIALDAENGLSFRIDSTVQYPHLITLGAINDTAYTYRMGREMGQQLRRMGVNVNFGPVIDVNSNPDNPVINFRSFGENLTTIVNNGWMLAKGMQDENIVATIKHFPGHGNTLLDSHFALPLINSSYAQIDSIDFFPFKALIDKGVTAIMSAHLEVPSLDRRPGRPSSLSSPTINGVLRDSFAFKGLIFTDAMNMKGVSKHFKEGEAEVQALAAGNDVVEYVINPEVVITAVKYAIEKGVIKTSDINEKCRRVLLAKKWCGLNNYKPIDLNNLTTDLNSKIYQLTCNKLFEKAPTVLINKNDIIPLKSIDTLRIATIAIGDSVENIFQKRVSSYCAADHFVLKKDADDKQINDLFQQLNNYNLIIACINNTKISPSKKYQITPIYQKVIDSLQRFNSVVLVHFGNPYSLRYFKNIQKIAGLMVTYQENDLTMNYAAQLIFGAIGTHSKLPITVDNLFKVGAGFDINSIGRLRYKMPEDVGISSALLANSIDSIVASAIKVHAFPGCQIVVAKDGNVFFNRSYGYHTYDSIQPVLDDDIYDWASITKIAGPLPAIMKLYDEHKIELDAPFSIYWPDFVGTDKESITLRDLLTHQARFRSGISFYPDALGKNNTFDSSVVRDRPSTEFSIKIASSLYLRNDYSKVIYEKIKDSKLHAKTEYVYSDLPSMLYPKMISMLTHSDYVQYLDSVFYKPMGLQTIRYTPHTSYPMKKIIPTENDTWFRKELIQGYVHDESSAMLGGISGNAGLFGSAMNLATIMQMYLQEGYYGGTQFIEHNTIRAFTKVQFPENNNRRGLGFDKPELSPKGSSAKRYPINSISASGFGHTGYTGTCTWVDPEQKIVFVLLSNRVYPTRENNKINALSVRAKIFQTVYDHLNTFRYDY